MLPLSSSHTHMQYVPYGAMLIQIMHYDAVSFYNMDINTLIFISLSQSLSNTYSTVQKF